MNSHDNEIFEPEELARLGSVFDDTWAALNANAPVERPELRSALASILLRLARHGTLEPHEMKATALRIFHAQPVTPPQEGQFVEPQLGASL